MRQLVARRLIFAVLLVAAASSAALLLTRLAPGDLTTELGPLPRPGEVAVARARFDLDRTPWQQWALWTGRALRFDFGQSFLYNRPVASLVTSAAVNTAVLGVTALVLATAVGVVLGVWTGSRGGPLPALVRAASLACLSVPSLLTSLVLIFIAARTGWLPPGGMSSPGLLDASFGVRLLDTLWHMPVPVVALALPLAATFERLQSQAVAEAVQQPFVQAARARGAAPHDLIWRHAWRVARRPICGVYGLAIGALLSGSFAVEYVTAWPGLGRLMYEALRARDIYLVAGCAAMGALLLAIGTLVGDLLLAFADPRVREPHAA
jgi:peptide/nickel transport system permease protein